jgi:hypothetical protein
LGPWVGGATTGCTTGARARGLNRQPIWGSEGVLNLVYRLCTAIAKGAHCVQWQWQWGPSDHSLGPAPRSAIVSPMSSYVHALPLPPSVYMPHPAVRGPRPRCPQAIYHLPSSNQKHASDSPVTVTPADQGPFNLSRACTCSTCSAHTGPFNSTLPFCSFCTHANM